MKNKIFYIFSILAIIFDISVFLLVLYSVLSFMLIGGEGNMEGISTDCFKYFTIDSNIVAGLICIACVPFHILGLVKKNYVLPKYMLDLKLVGTSVVTVTFATVMLFLGPTAGFRAMFEGANLYLHLVCPIMCIISLVIFDMGERIKFLKFFYCVVPVIIYGIVYALNVLVFETWNDFYGFKMGNLWYISAILMFIGTCLVAMLLVYLHNLKAKSNKQ